MDLNYKRNFCITAHIDHGKSTLSDRLIQKGKIIDERKMKDQLLDTMDIERERGITIKSQAVTIPYTAKDGVDYELNFVDTPGHVDFSYEVSRAIASCEGALLLIDATQGVESQTVSNMYMAVEHDLVIIPVINKIDLASADVEGTKAQITKELGLDGDEAVLVSAKTGVGVDELMEAIVARLPPPKGSPDGKLCALIFDCNYNEYRGVVVHVRIIDGRVKKDDVIRMMAGSADYKVEQVGIFKIDFEETDCLEAGDVGYIIAGIKTVSDVRVGDTITNAADPVEKALPGFKDVKPVVYSSIYPMDSNEYEELKNALEKLKLNDASLIYEKDNSLALGNGFRCGFWGLLHLEIVQERLEREYDLDLISTAPTVIYEVLTTAGETLHIDNPSKLPAPNYIAEIREPIITANILVPKDYLGAVIGLCIDKRGVQKNMQYAGNQVQLQFEMPMSEVVLDFFDRLKSVSRGFASFDYEFNRFEPANLVRVDVLINGDKVDSLAVIIHRAQAQNRGRDLVEKMKELIPRQMFEVAIQAAIGNQIIARSTVKALRKNVLAKCYGGDITRKRKLLEKQKAGKKRMKQVGSVEIPQEAFLAVLRVDDK